MCNFNVIMCLSCLWRRLWPSRLEHGSESACFALQVPAAEVHEKGEAKQQTEEDTDASGNPAGATG